MSFTYRFSSKIRELLNFDAPNATNSANKANEINKSKSFILYILRLVNVACNEKELFVFSQCEEFMIRCNCPFNCNVTEDC